MLTGVGALSAMIVEPRLRALHMLAAVYEQAMFSDADGVSDFANERNKVFILPHSTLLSSNFNRFNK